MADFRKSSWTIVLTIALLSFASSVEAGEITDVNDAADTVYYLNPEFPQCEEALAKGGVPDPLCKEAVGIPDPFDFTFRLAYQQIRERMKVNREKGARADVVGNGGFNKEMRYERMTSQINMEFDIGLYKDLEFHLKLPFVLSDKRSYKYAKNGDAACEFATNPDDPKCVNETNSTVDPSDERIQIDANGGPDDPFSTGFGTYRYFDLGDDFVDGPDRSGLGDMTIGLDWAIINDQRYFEDVGENSPWYLEHGRSSLVFGFDYTIPTADIATVQNTSVGEGVHWLNWRIATSRRYRYVEPYMQLDFKLGLPSSDGLFKDYEGGQTRIGPGPRGHIIAGFEIIPWEERPLKIDRSTTKPKLTGEHRKFSIDIQANVGIVGEGREYGPLFDALGMSACNGMTYSELAQHPECGWIAEKWSNAGFENTYKLDPFYNGAQGDGQDPNVVLQEDGITSYESYVTMGTMLGFYFQPSKYVQIKTRFKFDYQQDHFLTYAQAGKDVRGRVVMDSEHPELGTMPSDAQPADGTVSFDDIKERNPVYNPTYDGIGRRFRSAENTIFMWDLTLALQF